MVGQENTKDGKPQTVPELYDLLFGFREGMLNGFRSVFKQMDRLESEVRGLK